MVMNFTEVLINREVYAEQLINRFLDIVLAPYNHPEMLWIAIPLLITIFLMEFYFGKYKKEELGWNTAYGNAIVLIFVAVDLVRHVYNLGDLFSFHFKTLIIGLLIIDGVILVLIDFYHLLPKTFAFGLSSKLPINFLAYCAIIFVYTNISPTIITLAALLLFLIAIFTIMKIIDLMEIEEKN